LADEHAQLVARVEGRSLCGPDRLGARDTGGRQKEASSAAAPAAPASCVHLEYLRQDGNPQWQEQVGCIGAASGGYALGTALEQTVDGGYVISGGTRDCQFSPICPYLTSQACGLIVKLDAAGTLAWTQIYSSSATETTFWDVKQTGDGGFVAVGTYRDPNGGTGSLILKLDGGGTVQWQTLLVPLARTYAYLEAVQPTRDGGYVAAGQFYPLSSTGTGAGRARGQARRERQRRLATRLQQLRLERRPDGRRMSQLGHPDRGGRGTSSRVCGATPPSPERAARGPSC